MLQVSSELIGRRINTMFDPSVWLVYIPLVNSIPNEAPSCNYYKTNNYLQFTDHRQFELRHRPTNIFVDTDNDTVHNLSLCSLDVNEIVIHMPDDFIQTKETVGYFMWYDSIIVNVFSKYSLVASHQESTQQNVSLINRNDHKLYSMLEERLLKCGFINIVKSKSNIVASDKYFTIIIGDINNFEC